MNRAQGNTASCDDFMINTLLSALQLQRPNPCSTAQRRSGIQVPSWPDWGLSTRAYPSVSRNMSGAWDRRDHLSTRVYQNLKCFLYWSLFLFPSCKSLNSFFFPLSYPWSCFWSRKQTEQAPSWKQDSMLGQIVDFELYAQYLWKQHTNWKNRPPGRKGPRAQPRLCHLKEYPNYLCNWIES